MMDKELIRLSGLSKFYTGTQSVVIGLNSLDLTFSRGEFVAVTGESGSGKSTLSHVLGGILPYESGELFFRGEPTSHYDSADWERYRRDNISFISQNYGILPGATVLENVVSALLLTGMEKQEAHDSAEKLLKQVELWEMRSRRAAKLSSGQKQRLSIARALAKPAPVLIADEPTGNLDPENSAKVIELLAQAAKERLVILVTHEFSEAAQSATRHIVLRDGKVVMDASLRSPNPPQPMIQRKPGDHPVSLYVARLQQRSRPIWSALMAALFALTAFAVFAFLGTLIVNLDDSFTRIYDNSVFRNGDPHRIVAVTMDGRPMTQQDYDALVNIPNVERLEPNGHVTDIHYAYREDVDYEIATYESTTYGPDGMPSIQVHSFAKMYASAPYIQTVPVVPDGVELLSAGREPENLYEVIAVGDESLLGQTMTVYISNPDYWAVDQTLPLDVTVVGVTDCGSGLYFHEDLGRLCVQVAKTIQTGYVFLPVANLDNDHFRAHGEVQVSMVNQYRRFREKIARHQLLESPLPKEMKVFENINSGETVTMEIECTPPTGYYLWHLLSEKYMSYVPDTDWRAMDTEFPMEIFQVQLYPVDGTVPAADGSLTSGRYVIWNSEYGVALSRNTVPGITWPKHSYEDVPVTMDENGVLTGYTEDEVWDIEVKQGIIASITNEEGWLTTSSNYEYEIREIAKCWIIEEAKQVVGIHHYDNRRFIEVSYPRFDELTWNGGSEQVSLTIADYGYADRVLSQIQSKGYAALSPYQLGSNKQDPALAQQREQTLLICLLALLAVVALQMILMRSMFTAQMESYRLLSNIGLSARDAKHSVLWQILGFTLLGQMVSIAALAVCWQQKVERIVHIIHYLPLGYMIGLMAVHMLVSLAAAVWIQRVLVKQVYALTGRETDLPMDDDGKEAAL